MLKYYIPPPVMILFFLHTNCEFSQIFWYITKPAVFAVFGEINATVRVFSSCCKTWALFIPPRPPSWDSVGNTDGVFCFGALVPPDEWL